MGKKTKNAKKNKFVVPSEGGNNAVRTVKVIAKKAKKNKIIETSVDNHNETELSAPKPKIMKKNKAETPVEVIIENNVSKKNFAKKAKKNKITEMSVDAEDVNGSEISPPKAKKAKKNKQLKAIEESSENDEEIEMSGDDENEASTKIKKTKKKKNKQNDTESGEVQPKPSQNKFLQFRQGVTDEMIARYPVLNDEALANQFLAVKLNSSQKGRMRQILKSSLSGTPDALLPDVIHTRMKIILKTPTLTDTALRKLRILYGLLKTALLTAKPDVEKKVKVVEKSNDGEKEQKVKGPKRWVVFVGNLPIGITKEKILEHFADISDNIKDVRIPKKFKAQDPKSAIAYIEVTDNLNFELALSKHHTMLDNRRINVLYTAQSGSKISKTEAKGKAAKLVALQKSGKLAGSIPLSQKRSARRKKMKEAQKALAQPS